MSGHYAVQRHWCHDCLDEELLRIKALGLPAADYFRAVNAAVREAPGASCLVFDSDCHDCGAALHLCAKHLARALKEVRAHAAQAKARQTRRSSRA